MQRCAECGCLSELGQNFDHFDGCVHEGLVAKVRRIANNPPPIPGHSDDRRPLIDRYMDQVNALTGGRTVNKSELMVGTDPILLKHMLEGTVRKTH